MNQPGTEWVVLAVDQEVVWFADERAIQFRGRELIMRPALGNLWADVSLERRRGESYDDGATFLRRFLSVQAWMHEGQPFREMGLSGGTHRIRVGGRLPTQQQIFPGIGFPELAGPTTEIQDRALALYRDAINLTPNDLYKFLALFRILNISLANSRAQRDWINGRLGDVVYHQNRVTALRASVPDVGDYLYNSGRSAIAHAFNPPLIDPDNIEDTRRINIDLPLVKELVEIYMEGDLGLGRP